MIPQDLQESLKCTQKLIYLKIIKDNSCMYHFCDTCTLNYFCYDLYTLKGKKARRQAALDYYIKEYGEEDLFQELL